MFYQGRLKVNVFLKNIFMSFGRQKGVKKNKLIDDLSTAKSVNVDREREEGEREKEGEADKR